MVFPTMAHGAIRVGSPRHVLDLSILSRYRTPPISGNPQRSLGQPAIAKRSIRLSSEIPRDARSLSELWRVDGMSWASGIFTWS